MELKVWVEGIQRIVCGVTDATTCQDVVYVLVHATGKTGRFILVEKWRNNERLLPPHEHPLKVLSKWGEYAGDVQLVLRRSEAKREASPQDAGSRVTPDSSFHAFNLPPNPVGVGGTSNKPSSPPNREGPIKKSLTFSGGGGRPNQGDATVAAFKDAPKERRDWSEVPRGVVKGVPQQMAKEQEAPAKEFHSPNKDSPIAIEYSQYRGVRTNDRDPKGGGGPSGSNGRVAANSGYSPASAGCLMTPCSGARTTKIPGPQVSGGFHQPVHAVRSADSAAAVVGPPQGPRILRPPDCALRQNGTRFVRGGEQQDARLSPKTPSGWSPSQEPRPTPNSNGDCGGHSPNQAPPPASSRRNELQNPRTNPPHHGERGIQYGAPTSAHNSQSIPAYGSPPGVGPANMDPSAVNHGHGPYSPLSPHSNPVPIHMGTPKSRRNLLSEFKRHDLEEELREDSFLGRGHQERVVYDARYRELVRLINLQREKLSHQQADLTQCDAEIVYWEEKQKDHQRQIEVIEREIQKNEMCGRDAEEEIVQLDKLHLDDELEIGRQQEKMLQSELTLLRSKLSNCETELLQCKNKIRLLMDDISEDKRWLSKEEEDRKQREMAILNEIEDLQREVQDVFKGYDSKVSSWEKMEQDVHRLETAIADKKKQVEGLVQELKEANLESLAFTPSEEIRLLLEGGAPKGPGSSRKIVGSPRQLENAVPTSKNPHGVWV